MKKIEQLARSIVGRLGIFLTFIVSINMTSQHAELGYAKELQSNIDHLNCTVDSLYNQLEKRTCEVENLSNFTRQFKEDPLKLANVLVEQENFRQFVDSTQFYPAASKFRVKYNIRDSRLDEKLLAAMIDYSSIEGTPLLTVTSATRHNSSRSKHYYGKALDLRYNANLEQFLCWIEEPEGKAWLKKHNLWFYIEDNYWSSKILPWKQHYAEHVFMNRKASGPHVHLELRES
jgi:hypothetical protein